MQLPNKERRKATAQQIRDNEFRPNVGIGIFDFSIREKDLLSILGTDNKYQIDKRDKTVIYETVYNGEKIMFFFHYNGRGLDYLSLHLTSLKLSGTNIQGKKINEVIDIVKDFHHEKGKVFKYILEENEGETFIDFVNIGLSIWFESNIVSDISISG